MNQTPSRQRNHSSSATHRVLQKSSTLNRRYVKRPTAHVQTTAKSQVTKKTVKINVEDRADAERRRKILVEEMKSEANQLIKKHSIAIPITEEKGVNDKPKAAPQQRIEKERANATVAPAANPYSAALARHRAAAEAEIARQNAAAQISAQELKDQAIAKALSSVAQPAPVQNKKQVKQAAKQAQAKAKQAKPAKQATEESVLAKSFKHKKRRIGAAKFLLAFATSAACVAVLGYLVHLNMPDISVRVAAMQTGIEATYPNYIPRDYQLSSVATDQDNRVIMEFIGPEDAKFKLTEEKSSWDSNALLNNFVKASWGTNYTVVREQGITIYISTEADAAWVNGGLLYSLDSDGQLTKKQIKNIVTSL